MGEIDTLNRYMVAAQGGKVAIMRPPGGLMTQDEALGLAAWLVALADFDGNRFQAFLDAVRVT